MVITVMLRAEMKVLLILFIIWRPEEGTAVCTVQQMETYTVEGHAVRLACDAEQDLEKTTTYSWTKDNHTLETGPRLKKQGGSLWILSTLPSDSGVYVCTSNKSLWNNETRIFLFVEKGQCPRFQGTMLALEGTDIDLTCPEEPIEPLGQILQVQWLKDCTYTGVQGSQLNLNVAMNSMGNYTCMFTFGHDGQNYTGSYTVELKVKKSEPTEKPKVIYPRNHIVHIKPGAKTKLECTVLVGSEMDNMPETSVYWTVNSEFTQEYSQLQENLTYEIREDNQIYGYSTLFISEVLQEFFDVPFNCIVLSPNGEDMGVVFLKQENPHSPQTALIIALVITVVVAVLFIVLFVFFKIDIILAYRHLCGKSKTASEQMTVYNAYMCYCQSNTPGDLALTILPEVLEQEHDLKLFIHGRDDASTGENAVDITDVLSRCRTVLLVLPGSDSANHKEGSSIPLNPGQDELDASHCRELFTVITQSSIPVIVVESGENADYSLLPESIQSIIQTDRVLRWNPAEQPSGRFWKHLRYHMT